MIRRSGALLAGLALAAAACSGGGSSSSPSTGVSSTAPASTEVPTTVPATSPVRGPLGIDWADRDQVVTLDNGWTIEHCEGGAPLWCVDDGERTVQVIDLVQFPLEGVETLFNDPTVGGLANWSGEVFADLLKDRTEGCPEGYIFTQVPTDYQPVTGQDGIRYGFIGALADGTPSEATIGYATIYGRTLVILLSAAYDEGGCLPPEGPELTVEQLNTLAPYLDDIAAQSASPRPR